MIKKFVRYYRPHKKLFAIDLTCSFFLALLSLLYPVVVERIMTNFADQKNIELLIVSGGILLGVFTLMAILNFITQYWGHILGVRIQADLRSELFAHIQKLPFSFFDEHKTGGLMSRLISNLFEVAELAHHGPENVIISFITITGVFIILSFYNWILALALLILIPFMVVFAITRRKKMRVAFYNARARVADMNAELESSISGIRVAKAYAASDYEIEKFEKANTNFKIARAKAYKNMGIYNSSLGFFNNLLYFIAIIGGGLMLYFDVFSDPVYAVFLMFIGVLIKPIQTLITISEQIQDGMTGFTRFLEIVEIPPESEPENPVEIGTLIGEIKFENVTFSYSSKDTPGSSKVIKDLSLVIENNKTVAFVGPSGGGKTTLCNLIPRFYEIDSGTISIDGIDITKMRRADLRRNVGIVAQEVFLFAGSIKENIAYSRPNATDEEILDAAKRANIHQFVMTLPDGYNTQVGQRGAKLSGGQRQRISIARAFLKNPAILILDEATSALDNITETQIQSALEELSKGRTTIVVAHRLSTIKNSDEIFVLTADGITERGTHEELMNMNGFYSHMYSFYN